MKVNKKSIRHFVNEAIETILILLFIGIFGYACYAFGIRQGKLEGGIFIPYIEIDFQQYMESENFTIDDIMD